LQLWNDHFHLWFIRLVQESSSEGNLHIAKLSDKKKLTGVLTS
jgi:hypothetical protein